MKSIEIITKTTYTIDERGRLDLSELNLETLPDSIGKLKGLKTLSLRNNKLTALPDSIGELRELVWLDLDGNNLTTLPNSISELKELRVLDLDGNSLTISEVRRIKGLLPNCRVYS